ncbi:MAG: phosphoglucosamine mutase [Acidimicrobiia bacterium]|nr:phosphoglucosamine mutase [Acidimicrobiia bacterium]
MTSGSLFGTDGVRGVANRELTPQLAFDLARAAAGAADGVVFIGRDTRRSGPMLSAALHAGFTSVGVDTVDLGVLPVGGVSRLTISEGAAMGVMVSASHNPAADNGVKLIGPGGTKLPDAAEEAITARFLAGGPYPQPTGAGVGSIIVMDDALNRYVDHLATEHRVPLDGMEIVLDCANGAASIAAPALFTRLGAKVEVHAADPDGLNINDNVGATHPETLARLVGGRVGFCFDGDADRLIAIDEDGVVANGDVILAVLADHLKGKGLLTGERVVTTVMANLGFLNAMTAMGIEVAQTKVGDRYVLEHMERVGAVLGGEQSGHVMLEDRISGDGLRTALRVAEVMATTGSQLRALRTVITEFPQVLVNVKVADRNRLAGAAAVWAAVAEAEGALGDRGRVLVRASGTEPLVRVMVEAATAGDAQRVARSLVEVVSAALR